MTGSLMEGSLDRKECAGNGSCSGFCTVKNMVIWRNADEICIRKTGLEDI